MLLVPNQSKVSCNQSQQDARDDQNVGNVQTRNDDLAWEITCEHNPVQPSTDDRQGNNDGRHDSQANTGKQVVRQE